MTKSLGTTPIDKRDRRHLLSKHMDQLIDEMKQSGITNPVGIVVDPADKYGRVWYLSELIESGMTKEEANRHLREMTAKLAESNQFPTMVVVVSWADAVKILHGTSPTARKNLYELRNVHKVGTDGKYLVVAVGNGGNTYGFVNIPEKPSHDEKAHA